MSQFEPEGIHFEREMVVLEEIQKNPNIHHNGLIKLLVPKYMAKSTFEKTKNKLIEKNVLSVRLDGNKKFYSIVEDYQKKPLQLMERISHEKYQFLQHQIKKFQETYIHKDVNEKISLSIELLSDLLKTDNEFTILDSIKNSKKTLYKDEHQNIQEMIAKIFELIVEDKKLELIFPIVMKNIKRE